MSVLNIVAAHLGAVNDAGTLRFGLANLLNLFHECVGDGHAGELLLSAVGAGVRVPSQTPQNGHVESKLVLEPVDAIGRIIRQHADQFGARQMACTLHGVFIKRLGAVSNLGRILSPSST